MVLNVISGMWPVEKEVIDRHSNRYLDRISLFAQQEGANDGVVIAVVEAASR